MSISLLRGQALAGSMLQGMLRSGRIGHAYLFVGHDGTGKSVFAREFAKAVQCLESPTLGDSCDACGSCLRVASGNHPDVLEIRPDGRLKIDQVREGLGFIGYKPLEGRYKVLLLPHAESMTEQAANCLLKALEEPPGDALFILTATSPVSVLPTVVSRCQIVPFGPSPVEDVVQYLKEKHPEDPDKCMAAAFWSGGIPGDADTFFEESFLSVRDKALAVVLDPGGLDPVEFAGEAGKEDIPLLLSCLVSLFRDVAVLGLGYRESPGNPDLSDRLAGAVGTWSHEAAVQAIDETFRTGAAISANANKRLALEVLLMKLQALADGGYN